MLFTVLIDQCQWHAYNLIQPADRLRARALRRITRESDAGSVSSTRIPIDLTILVTSTDFDAPSAQLHVAGRVTIENEHVKLGSYHTLDLELQRKFTIEKTDGWDSVALEALGDACDPAKKAELWAVVMQEGMANVCIITEHQTVLRQRVEVPIPRKRKGGLDGHNKTLEKFFSLTLQALQRQMDIGRFSTGDQTTPLLLASPGFVAANFLEYIKRQATSTTDKVLLSLVPSILVAHASSGHQHALTEVLSSTPMMAKLADTKYARETALMDKFEEMLRRDDGRAWYGPAEVERAVAKGAVGRGGGVLLISNALFRAQNVADRKRWVCLVDRVRETEGGEVRVLSSLHESGRRLAVLGDIAAILTFPLHDLDIVSEDEGDYSCAENDSSI